MNILQFRTIAPLSADYEEMVDLRMKVLLEPIGISRSYINPEKETDDILIGAYMNGTLVGCCILTKIDDDIVQLRQMAVSSTLQKSGIGRQVLSFAESIAREKGFRILLMHARDGVISFYKKCGYDISGDQFFEVGIPHYEMQKNLLLQNV